MIPSVNITELDGAIGTLPSGTPAMAIVGVCDSGPLNTPAAFARIKDIVSTFGGGPAVEAAAHYIQLYNRPVIMVRTGNTVVGTYGSVTNGITGTSVPTTAAGPPNDDYEFVVNFPTGGTIGVAGITFTYSLDGGRTPSPVQSLGTANFFVFPNSGGSRVNFAAGTINAGDTVSFRGNAPLWNGSEIGAALGALAVSTLTWDLVQIVGAIDGTGFDAIATAMAAMPTKAWMGGVRMPNSGESEATYLSSLTGIFDAKSNTFGMLCAGAAQTVSGVSFRQYRRQSSVSICARQGSVSEEIDIAAPILGSLAGVNIRDTNGNPVEHDETVNPGLDDARFAVLRTLEGYEGVFVNNPNLFSPVGSDFQYMQHRRVMNIAKIALQIYFRKRLSQPIQVNASTGFILESEALEIEAGARSIMRSVLRAKPKASAVDFTLSRTDNLLSTKTLTGQARVTPLAYPKTINLDLGFHNPALNVVTS